MIRSEWILRHRTWAACAALLAASLTGGYMVFERTSAANEQPRHVTIALLERVRDFIAANEIPLTSRQRLAGYYVDPDKTADTSPFTLEGLITVAFEDGAQSFTLPPGRSLIVAQQAGIIQDFTMTLFDAPKPFDAARRFLRSFVDELDHKDWRAVGGIAIPTQPDDLDSSGAWTTICQMKDRHGNQLELTMIDHGRAPKQESWITIPLGRSDTASQTYLVQVSVYQRAGASQSYGEAVYPRRLYVNGAIGKDLPLRAWIDEPDWLPAAHGMVAAPHAERKGDVSYWLMQR